MMIMDSDSKQDPTFPADEDAEIADGDKKIAAVDNTAHEHRKEAAKLIASLRQTPNLHDTDRQEGHKEPPKKANQAQSKKRKASTVVNSGKTLVPILPGRKK
jgi:hypothetical protein